jgi:hypothetical protein
MGGAFIVAAVLLHGARLSGVSGEGLGRERPPSRSCRVCCKSC